MPKTSKERIAEQFLAAADDVADGLRSQTKLHLIAELCRALAKLPLSVGMGDARPAAFVYGPMPLSVTVDDLLEYFVWWDGQHRHPVSDPVGAAQVIEQHITIRRSETGKSS
ncbi:hypothetical protein [Actinoallomurus acaciae]|uniref:Uncharacterized protein n=1 Tax=Actinoallomurus acaciae TaxID=502577 RepID=A0ABV5YEM6_9ACTN